MLRGFPDFIPMLSFLFLLLLKWFLLSFYCGFSPYLAFISVFSTYILVCAIANRFPTFIHRKRNTVKFKHKHISHRGGAGERIENTLSAFENSSTIGTDMFELDCQVTKDQKVVVAHENDMFRICGIDGTISTTNFADLPPINPELDLCFLKGWTTIHRKSCNGKDHENILLLEDVLVKFPDVPLNIDPKLVGNVRHVEPLIRKYNRESTVAWGSSEEGIVEECFRLNPTIPLIISEKRFYIMIGLYFIGLLPFVPIHESLLEIPFPSILIRRAGHSCLNLPNSVFIDFLSRIFDFFIFNFGLLQHFKRRGITVLTWVLNEKPDYQMAFDVGFDGIMTDFPSRLQEFLSDYEKDTNGVTIGVTEQDVNQLTISTRDIKIK